MKRNDGMNIKSTFDPFDTPKIIVFGMIISEGAICELYFPQFIVAEIKTVGEGCDALPF